MTPNRFLVGAQGDTIVILLPKDRLTKAEAVSLAVWLAYLSDPQEVQRHLAELEPKDT